MLLAIMTIARKIKIRGASINRTYHMESSLIKVVFHWMYAQQFFLCITTYVNERIYQNFCMGVHKTKSFNEMIWNRVPKGNHVGYGQGRMLGAATGANAAPQKSSH